jgi:hypothetical protein
VQTAKCHIFFTLSLSFAKFDSLYFFCFLHRVKAFSRCHENMFCELRTTQPDNPVPATTETIAARSTDYRTPVLTVQVSWGCSAPRRLTRKIWKFGCPNPAAVRICIHLGGAADRRRQFYVARTRLYAVRLFARDSPRAINHGAAASPACRVATSGFDRTCSSILSQGSHSPWLTGTAAYSFSVRQAARVQTAYSRNAAISMLALRR